MVQTVAITFNSIAMGVGKLFTSTVVLQACTAVKYSAYTLLYAGKSFFMLVKKTVTSTILSQLLPQASSTAFTLAKH